MSFWDVIVSIAMALNTFPMPSDVYEVYPFAGKALGTVGTCEIQGFLVQIGTLFVFGSNTTLNIYYVCTFRYSMAEEKFKRRIMPVMLAFYMAVSIAIPLLYPLRQDIINPSPYYTFCVPTKYPHACSTYSELDVHDDMLMAGRQEESINVECIRGGYKRESYHTDLTIIGSTFGILIISMVLVVATVFDAELGIRRGRRRALQGATGNGARNPVRRVAYFERTRAILIQALMYVGAFLLTYIWSILVVGVPTGPRALSNVAAFLNVFFRPLQGFLNAMIFVYQKVHTLRRTNRTLSFLGAFKRILLSPSSVPQNVVSQIKIATEEIDIRRQNRDLLRYPGSLTTEQRQEIAHNSGMRRFGYENDNTPPASIPSGVGSSSLGDISFGDVIGSSSDDEVMDGNDDGDVNTLGGFGEGLFPVSLSTDATPLATNPRRQESDDVGNQPASSFSMDSTLDSIF